MASSVKDIRPKKYGRRKGDKSMSGENGRVSRIEEEVGGLKSQVSAMDTDIKHISREVGNLASAFRSFTESYADKSKTSWGILAAWSSVILMIVGLVGTGFVGKPMHRIEEALIEMIKTQRTHELQGGHMGAMKDITSNSEKIENLDAVLQREMRLLKDESDSRLKGIAERIDSETDILERQMLENRSGVSGIRERISKVEVLSKQQHNQQEDSLDVLNDVDNRVLSWQESHDQRVVGLNATQTTRLNELEKRLNRFERPEL